MKNEIKFVPVAPKIYEVRYVENENQEVKVSPLSAAARSKVINKSGSNYVSENQEVYGPCPEKTIHYVTYTQGCMTTKADFNVYIGLGGDFSFYMSRGLRAIMPIIEAKVEDKDKEIPRIQSVIDDLKNGKIYIAQGASEERNEQCIKYEGYFESKLEEVIEKINEMGVYDLSRNFYVTKP